LRGALHEQIPMVVFTGESLGYGEKVEEPGEVRAALQRGLKAIASGQMALIDIRLAKAAESNERPDRAN